MSEQKDFFRMMAKAAFSNPFGSERPEIDRLILGESEPMREFEHMEDLIERLDAHLLELGNPKRFVGKREKDPDAEAVAVSILFKVFHEYKDSFDRLIEKQISVGDESCRAPDAFECMRKLQEYGFKKKEACRYTGIFYQIRRAFYFISKGLIGESSSMRKLRTRLWDNVFTHDIAWYVHDLWDRMEDFSTLLLGETGTGKGAAAAAIGRAGFIPFDPQRQKFEESFTSAFVAINLSQYPETLIESELFGHRRGSFTGAVDEHDGIFARCSPHGSIFLDEIGDVSVPVQIKLLQVLQDRTFSPVGSHDVIRFEGRVIAATNKSLDNLRREGNFRDDFFYRLCSDVITVPCLRERIREMPRELDLLTNHLLRRITGGEPRIPAVELLNSNLRKEYPWPGNVRELEQAIRRIILTGSYEGDGKACGQRANSLAQTLEVGGLTAKELVEKYCFDLYQASGSYGEVARRTGLDWRTVKKYVIEQSEKI